MRTRVVAFLLFCAGVPATVWAQNVEMVFTPAVAEQAVALKSAMSVDKTNVNAFGALALVGAPAARKKAYADSVAKNAAVVIVGEDALKAVAEIEFSVPVIVVNATGKCAARVRVIRVFDAGSTAAPPGAVLGDSIASVGQAVRSGGEVVLKGNVTWIVRVALAALR